MWPPSCVSAGKYIRYIHYVQKVPASIVICLNSDSVTSLFCYLLVVFIQYFLGIGILKTAYNTNTFVKPHS